MERKKQWLDRLKIELSNSPLVSNTAFGFILTALEKLVELEFECPCNPKWNGLFSSAFFIIPTIMAFILMLITEGCRCDEWFKKTVSSSVPAIVWLILLFFDGQYFTCAMTDWKGRFVFIDKAAPQKWCEPISEGNFTTQELMLRSKEWIFKSQVIAILLLIFICMGLTVYLIRNSCQEKKQTDPTEEMNPSTHPSSTAYPGSGRGGSSLRREDQTSLSPATSSSSSEGIPRRSKEEMELQQMS